ncbi:ER lumen protein retaining receptor-domain-containing protein [Mycotypha africana]|uniref:ER lumen protein retaining receptor-domain-containing protein n=1 Tax=Mycotypha africana TaxID=64632 RepID=UPI0023004F40|nr:ER lumen protein retaining receptor-domain-containing protein [Mycotypha africana]KAI8988608.1 ER lumen protein retaining receptor-domain-containing protein [Mycotypha africana]
MLNLFRLSADLIHLLSIFILLAKIKQSRSCVGISLKSQILYCVVFLTRYVDVIYVFHSIYNTCMKIFFILSSIYVIYLMKSKFKATYDPNLDTFRNRYLVLFAAIFSLIFCYDYTVVEVLWSFSIWLESVAILPQLFMLQRTGEAETITVHYIFALGAYRAFYLLNWIYRYNFEPNYTIDWIASTAGLLQTILYSDFFYIYYIKVVKGQKFELPK